MSTATSKPTSFLEGIREAHRVKAGGYSGDRRSNLPPPEERRKIREGARVTQTAAAQILGVSRVAFCLWEDGSHTPTLENEARYRQFLADCRTYAHELALDDQGEKIEGGNAG